MLTRLEVDGFKNLLGFTVDFGPFTCIAGPNSVGKSNVFDAIRFLSLLSDHTIMEAAMLIRGDVETSDVRDLFWTQGENRLDHFTIAAEMIVDPTIEDEFGRPAEATSTYLRYEIEIGYEPAMHRRASGRLVLLSESLNYITEGEATKRLGFPHSATHFRRTVVHNKRRSQTGFISVREFEDGPTQIIVHQDGAGPSQIAPAMNAPRTIIATSTTILTPTIVAARREMQRWRLLTLDPAAMRKPDRFQTDPFVTATGGHIPATVNRLLAEAEAAGADPHDIYAAIASRVAELVPVTNVEVDVDEIRQLLTLFVREQSGARLPAASLSDGTLRFIALSVLLADPFAEGVICVEEPENGIHPAKMAEMLNLLRDLAVDSYRAPGIDNPFRQVITATHSPFFVQLQRPDDLLVAVEARVKGPYGLPARTLRCRPLHDTWRAQAGEQAVGPATILAYLSSPPGAQLEVPELQGV
ncbi:MAG: AAA family ATPase [Gemmatimonadota bacterium]